MSTPEIDAAIGAACAKYGLTPDFVTADIQHESNFDPLAIGDGGRALGLMQVHLVAAQDVNLETEWYKLHEAIATKDEATAVSLGVQIGVAYLARMMHIFGNDEMWALAAYNQGIGVISKAHDYAKSVLSLLPK